MTSQETQTPDTIIAGACIVSMDGRRTIFKDGAIAVRKDRLVAVGPTNEVLSRYDTPNPIDGSRFVITPGLINGHIHVTGDPLTRAWLPDKSSTDFEDDLTRRVLPRFHGHSPQDERVSAELAGLKMLRTGTTCFVEAGTVNHLDRVVEGLLRTGIRGRVGAWVEGQPTDGGSRAKAIDAAVRALEQEVRDYPSDGQSLISAWPILVGHSTNPDEVWQAAKSIADQHNLRVTAHMSPYADDPNWFVAQHGRRPIEHLAHIGVLGNNVCLTHLVHIDANEQAILADAGTHVVLCPLAALRGAFGLVALGRFPEMLADDINIMLGSDGFDQDLLRQAQIFAAVFKDARQEAGFLEAAQMLETLTVNGAKGLGLEDEIGSLEVGKKADFVCHDTDRPEWRPRQDVLNQLAWLVDGRSVHSVWVNGVRVIEDYRSTMIDEQALYGEADQSSAAVMNRAGLPMDAESGP